MKKFLLRVPVILIIAVLSACGDTVGPDSLKDSSPLGVAVIAADVAMIAADAAIDELGDMGLLFSVSGTLAAPGTQKQYRTRTFTYFDADGIEQAARDPLTTASMHLVIASTHKFSRDSWMATGERTRDLIITGLAGEETSRTVNGTGGGSVARSRHTDEPGRRTYDMSSTSVMENVVYPVPRTDDAWPLSGTVTRQMTVNIVNGHDGDVTKSHTAVTVFNGTNMATMTVGEEAFEIDLSTRNGRRPFRRIGGAHPSGN